MKIKFLPLVFFLIIFASCGEDSTVKPVENPPKIIEIIPDTAETGQFIKVTGANFDADSTTVKINETSAKIDSITATEIRLVVPDIDSAGWSPSEDGSLKILKAYIDVVTPKAAARDSFIVKWGVSTFEPTLSFAPEKTTPGDTVRIWGINFLEPQKELSARFGDTKAEIISVENKHIKVIVPPVEGESVISVDYGFSRYFSSNKIRVFIHHKPEISGFEPLELYEDNYAFLKGYNFLFLEDKSLTRVFIGDIEIQRDNIILVYDEFISFFIERGAAGGKIIVDVAGKRDTSEKEIVVKSSTAYIDGFEPKKIGRGDTLTISGQNFDALTHALYFVGDKDATLISKTDTEIKLLLIQTYNNEKINIHFKDEIFSSKDTITYKFRPNFWNFDPKFGSPGSNILITGEDFRNATTQMNDKFYIGDIEAPLKEVISEDKLSIRIPAGAETDYIRLVRPDTVITSWDKIIIQ